MADKKLIAIGVVVVLLIGGIYLFSNSDMFTGNNGNRTITDMAGRSVQVPSHVEKVMGFDASNREVCYLGCADKIIGLQGMETKCLDDLPYLVANPELKNKTNMGSLDDGSANYEELIKKHPDVVFVDSAQKAQTIESKTGLPAVVVYTGMIGTDDQYKNYTESLKLMGKVLGKEDRANELVGFMDEEISDLKTRSANAQCNKTVYVGGHAYFGDHGLSYTNSYYPSFNYLHLNNVASGFNNSSDATHRAMDVGKEQLITWNPDIIFIESSSIITNQQDSIYNPEYRNLSAVKNGNVYEIFTYCMYFYNKEEMITNSYYIGKICYPDQFADVDVDQKNREIFEKFLGKDIYDEFKKSSNYKYEKLNVTG